MSRRGLKDYSTMARIFFKCLDERKWKEAEGVVKKIQIYKKDKDKEKGYIDALKGMLTGYKERHSSKELLILTIGDSSQKELEDLQKEFYSHSNERLNTDYDRDFFRAWNDYTKFLITKNSK